MMVSVTDGNNFVGIASGLCFNIEVKSLKAWFLSFTFVEDRSFSVLIIFELSISFIEVDVVMLALVHLIAKLIERCDGKMMMGSL